jgi:hypothetical protein
MENLAQTEIENLSYDQMRRIGRLKVMSAWTYLHHSADRLNKSGYYSTDHLTEAEYDAHIEACGILSAAQVELNK